MNKKQYNNVIENTLKHEQSEDSLGTARAIFNNMGVALPQGDIKTVYETISTDNYMGWKSCTMQEAQAAADNGTAAIGISEDRIVVLSANDEEQPVAHTASVMTLDENTSAFAVEGMRYYSYGYGDTNRITINGWLDLYTSPSISGRTVYMPSGCNPNTWYAFEGLSNINYYARLAIGNTNSVYRGSKGELYDKDGRYWVAVGPKVMNPSHSNSATVTADEMNYGSRIEVKLKHSSGKIYYFRAIVGDCKNHTYPNGIYQTGRSFPNGTEYYPQNADGSVIEFCGSILSSGLNQFSIQSIIVED